MTQVPNKCTGIQWLVPCAAIAKFHMAAVRFAYLRFCMWTVCCVLGVRLCVRMCVCTHVCVSVYVCVCLFKPNLVVLSADALTITF